jgi:diguanylate cyclase (GGDEF)-like protein
VIPPAPDLVPAFAPHGLFLLGLALFCLVSLHSLLLAQGHRGTEGLGALLAATWVQGLGLLALLGSPWLGGAPAGNLLLLLGAGCGLWATRRYAGRPARLDRWGWIALGSWIGVALGFRAMGFHWVQELAVPAALTVLALGQSRELGLLAWQGVPASLARVAAGTAALLAVAALVAGGAAVLTPADSAWRTPEGRAWFVLGCLGTQQGLAVLLAQIQGQRVLAGLRRLTGTDPATGLASAQGFRDRMERAVARSARTGRVTSILILELDGFQNLLEAHGAASLAHILEAFAISLNRTLREVDLCGRLEGGRFAALLHQTQPGEALLAAERVRVTWADLPLTQGSRSFHATLSGGVASTREPVSSCQELLELGLRRAAAARDAGGDTVLGVPTA